MEVFIVGLDRDVVYDGIVTKEVPVEADSFEQAREAVERLCPDVVVRYVSRHLRDADSDTETKTCLPS